MAVRLGLDETSSVTACTAFPDRPTKATATAERLGAHRGPYGGSFQVFAVLTGQLDGCRAAMAACQLVVRQAGGFGLLMQSCYHLERVWFSKIHADRNSRSSAARGSDFRFRVNQTGFMIHQVNLSSHLRNKALAPERTYHTARI